MTKAIGENLNNNNRKKRVERMGLVIWVILLVTFITYYVTKCAFI